MKRSPQRKKSKKIIPGASHRSPRASGPNHQPSNYELTPAQVAIALDAFTEAMSQTEEALRQGLERLPQLAGQPLLELTKSCMKMEDFLTEERATMIRETEHLHEHALAHVMCHYCAIEPGFMEKIIKLAPHADPPVPQVLPPQKLKHFEAITGITGRFLKTMA